MKLRDLWMYPKWRWCRLVCRVRGHADPVCIGVVPVPTASRKRRRIEMAQKWTCSRCGTVLDLVTNREWRRGMQRGVPNRRR